MKQSLLQIHMVAARRIVLSVLPFLKVIVRHFSQQNGSRFAWTFALEIGLKHHAQSHIEMTLFRLRQYVNSTFLALGKERKPITGAFRGSAWNRAMNWS